MHRLLSQPYSFYTYIDFPNMIFKKFKQVNLVDLRGFCGSLESSYQRVFKLRWGSMCLYMYGFNTTALIGVAWVSVWVNIGTHSSKQHVGI